MVKIQKRQQVILASQLSCVSSVSARETPQRKSRSSVLQHPQASLGTRKTLKPFQESHDMSTSHGEPLLSIQRKSDDLAHPAQLRNASNTQFWSHLASGKVSARLRFS